MALFTPPVGTSVKSALNAETLDDHDSSEFAESNGIDGTEFKINKSNNDTFIKLTSQNNYPNAGDQYTQNLQQAFKYGEEDYFGATLESLVSLFGTKYVSNITMTAINTDIDRTAQSVLNTEINNTYLKLSDSSTNGCINITDESIVFNNGTDDVAEFATDKIEITSGSNEPTIYLHNTETGYRSYYQSDSISIYNEDNSSFGIDVENAKVSNELWYDWGTILLEVSDVIGTNGAPIIMLTYDADEATYGSELHHNKLKFTSDETTLAEFATDKIELTANDPYIKFTSPLYDAETRLSSTGLTIEHGDCTLENYVGTDTIQAWIGYNAYTVSADITDDIPMIYVSDESGSENKISELYCDKLQLKTDDTVSAEFSTTGITIGSGHVPVYWGESASEPVTYAAGDSYYNTGDSKIKMYITSVGWISLN